MGDKRRLTRKSIIKTAKTIAVWCGDDNKEGNCAES